MAIFALVDCNNFYASCERLFQPKFNNKPLIVLSNNDGCVIARSNEAKALGIIMGVPFFKVKALCQQHRVKVFSSNYVLYGDMSQRVMSVLSRYSPDMEVYSIDEAFLQLDKLPVEDYEAYALQIRQYVFKCTGIPVSVGIGPTKTLAKLANFIAKKQTQNGVFSLVGRAAQARVLPTISVGEVWGVGRQSVKKLDALGIFTVQELKEASLKWIKKKFSKVMERVIVELHGQVCLALEDVAPKQNICCSRSFGQLIDTEQGLAQALAYFVARACYKARQQSSVAQALQIFVRTRLFNQVNSYENSITIPLVSPTNDAVTLTKLAKEGLGKIFKSGYPYAKAGVLLLDLRDERHAQSALFPEVVARSQQLMPLLDKVNKAMGQQSLFFLSEGIDKPFATNNDYCSQRYTTCWREICVVGA
jgi:DNA polymerase V